MDTTDRGAQPRVLLAPYTTNRDVVDHYAVLSLDLRYLVDVKLNDNVGEYDLIVQIGLGPDPVKIKGLEYLRALRNYYPTTPILVVSGHDPSYALGEVQRAGADDFLQKTAPNEMEEFKRRVQALLKRKTAG